MGSTEVGPHDHCGRYRASAAARAAASTPSSIQILRCSIGSLLVVAWGLSRVHWIRPQLVAEVKFLTWTQDGLLRPVIHQGLREDKPATDVRRPGSRP